MKLAVIGAGYWGKNHIREYLSMGHDVTVFDKNQELLKQREQDFPGFKPTDSIEEILNDENIKAVSVCTPNETHFEITKKLLEANKDVLLEKPMTLSSEDARKLVELAKEKGLLLTVGHIFRFNNALKKLKELIDSGELGDVFLAKLVWTNLEPIFENRDVLFDLSPHAFDIINFLFGKNPEEISCVGDGYRRNDAEEAAFVNCRLGKTIINLEVSWLTPQKVRSLYLVGSKASAFVDCLKQSLEIYENDSKERKEIAVEPSNPLKEEIHNFIDSISDHSKAVADSKIGFEIISILEQAKKSMDEKRTIHL